MADSTQAGEDLNLVAGADGRGVSDIVFRVGQSNGSFLEAARIKRDGTGSSGWATVLGGATPAISGPHLVWFGTALKRALISATESIGLAILTDSTANALTDWFAQLGVLIAAAFPAYAVNYRQWSDAIQDYLAAQVIQASPGAARSVRFASTAYNSNFVQGAAAQATVAADLDVSANVSLDLWVPATAMTIAAHFGAAGQRSWRFQVLAASGKLYLETCTDGTTLVGHTSSVAPVVANGQTLWVRATLIGDNGAAGHNVKFWTSTDGFTWTQLGTVQTVAGTITTLFNSTAQWEIGARQNNQETLVGNLYEVRVRVNSGEPAATTTATGVNAANAGTVNAASTAAFPTAGVFALTIAAVTYFVSYTGKTATSFTGCSGNTVATAGGETIAALNGPIILPCMPEHWQGPPSGAAGYGTPSTTVGSPVLNIVDAGAAGFGITYLSDTTRIKKMLPDYGLRGVFLSESHNDSNPIGVGGGRDRFYATNYKTWISNVEAWAYAATPVIVRQNPRIAPAGNIVDHAIRGEMQLAIAASLGLPALDARQAFLDASGNVLVAYIQADGIHPTATGAGDGMHRWASYAFSTALFPAGTAG